MGLLDTFYHLHETGFEAILGHNVQASREWQNIEQIIAWFIWIPLGDIWHGEFLCGTPRMIDRYVDLSVYQNPTGNSNN